MLHEIPLSILNETLEIWGEEVLKSYRHSLPGIAKRLVVKELIPLEAETLTPSATKGGAYAVIPWLVGQRMAAKPMKTQPGAPVKLFETADYRHNRDGMTLLRPNDLIGFAESALKFRPDVAMLAVMKGEQKMQAQIQELREKLKAAGIEFQLLTEFDYRAEDDLPLL